MDRRQFIQLGLWGGLFSGCTSLSNPNRLKNSKVVVVGGGFGGATAAKYVRILSGYGIEVTLIEPNMSFLSCPMSNLVVGGQRNLQDITFSYDQLKSKHGVRLIRDHVEAFDADKRWVRTGSGLKLPYDKLILAPGIDLMMQSIEGLAFANKTGATLQAWKAGQETLALRKQLEAMPNGGVYVISVPLMPYRCPPGPYERASLVANYFKQHKKRAKVIVLDANPDVTSKSTLFKNVWESQYKGLLEYRPNQHLTEVDGKTKTVRFEFDTPLKANVLNLLPDMRAGKLAIHSSIANINKRWVEVNYQTFESTQAKHVHVIGDAIQSAPLMPKSGHMANSQAKVAAAAIVADLSGWEPNSNPLLNNTCYSYVNSHNAIHVSSVHTYNQRQGTYLIPNNASAMSSTPSELEALYAWGWAQNIWVDCLG